MTWKLATLLAFGGALGTLARYGVSVLAAPYSQALPWGTMAINVVGSFVIGVVGTWSVGQGRTPWGDDWRLFAMVGLCGGFTTFSAFSLQTVELLRAGAVLRGGVNVVASVVACLVATASGQFLAGWLQGDAPTAPAVSVDRPA